MVLQFADSYGRNALLKSISVLRSEVDAIDPEMREPAECLLVASSSMGVYTNMLFAQHKVAETSCRRRESSKDNASITMQKWDKP